MTLGRLHTAFHYQQVIYLYISIRGACAIPDPDNEEQVIITGGGEDMTLKTVSVYSKSRWQTDMTSLNQGRSGHGCGSYLSGGKRVIFFLMYHTCFIDTFNASFLWSLGDFLGPVV